MGIIENILIILIALLHFWFLILEMFLWDKPSGLKVFRHSLKEAQTTKVLAMNQGLYNGFLAAGLTWSLLANEQADSIKIFFLSCIIVAGIFGAITVHKKIIYIQAYPAVIVLLLVLLSN